MRQAHSDRLQKCSAERFFLSAILIILNVFVLLWAADAGATGFIKVGERAKGGGDSVAEVTIVSETVGIKFSNQMAKTRVVQIFKNNTGRILEGEYIFPLPFGANIVSFATWDDGVKIDGVIMEKVKAKKIYDDIVSQMKDPGLLENIGSNTFCAKIFPIPAYGTKRLEMEYVEYLPLLNRLYSFTYPLYSEDMDINARSLTIDIELASDFEVVSPQIYFKNIAFVKNSANSYTASYSAPSFNDKLDFKATFSLDLASDKSKTITYTDKYKDSEEIYFLTTFRPFENEKDADAAAPEAKPKKAVFLIDTSYSMRGEKTGIIQKLFSSIETLDGYDSFNVIFFDSSARAFEPEFIKADAAGFSRLRSRLEKIKPFGASKPITAVRELIGMIDDAGGAGVNAILISDGLYPATDGERPLAKVMKEAFETNAPAKKYLTVSALAVGAGCENDRLTMVSNAFMGEFREIKNLYDDQAQLVVPAILKSMAGGIVKNVKFTSGAGMSSMLYPEATQNVNFDSECYAVGKLLQKSGVNLDIEYEFRGVRGGRKIEALIKESGDWYVPLLWARLRVNHLVARIDEYGETEEMRREIIELSKRFNFVTKYTSFLAVPPSVLRPRRIKPGDPEISISAPKDSKLVLVKLPFAEAMKAEYDEAKGLFVARFTAPAHIKDGRYEARVMIVDKFNREKHHALDFFIDSTPPVIYAKCLPERITRGGELIISANASPDTASIKAKMPDGQIVELKYDPLSKLSRAHKRTGANDKTGVYKIELEAIDHAGNRSVKFIEYTLSGESASLDAAAANKSAAGDGNAK